MIDEILQITEDLRAQRNRIDNATNIIVTATTKFRQFEQAIINLDAAIASLKVAILLIQDSQVDKIIWALDEEANDETR